MGQLNISQQPQGVNQAHLNFNTSSASVRHGEYAKSTKDTMTEKKAVDSKESWAWTILCAPLRLLRFIVRKIICLGTLGKCCNDNDVKLSAKEQLDVLKKFADVKKDEKAAWVKLNEDNPSIQKGLISAEVNRLVALKLVKTDDKVGKKALEDQTREKITKSFKDFDADAQNLIENRMTALEKQITDAANKEKASE